MPSQPAWTCLLEEVVLEEVVEELGLDGQVDWGGASWAGVPARMAERMRGRSSTPAEGYNTHSASAYHNRYWKILVPRRLAKEEEKKEESKEESKKGRK